jgi:hypothetical protein
MDGISLQSILTEGRLTDQPSPLEISLPKDRYIANYWGNRLSIRSQQYRLDSEGRLYDIASDRGQKQDLSAQFPGIRTMMQQVAANFARQIEKELPEKDTRPFYLGHPEMKYTQIPARDGTARGSIQRSNRWPNCSFFTHWTQPADSITWDVEVPADGRFRVFLYYTCKEGDEGSTLRLQIGESRLDARITEAWDPPLRGMEEDLSPRQESYVKDWKAMDMGIINLEKGKAVMSLTALEMPGNSVIDFRLFLFERL